MSYYKTLGLDKEPFSTSPDAQFFYLSHNHNVAFKRLEINIRLRRGLSLILGDVGTGKTTLSRTLLQAFKDESDFIFNIILDPGFESQFEFLSYLARVFNIDSTGQTPTTCKEVIKEYLFQKGVIENKTVVLIIDEGQKLSSENLEVLRTLLNYETNEYKLLQLVIMAQLEFLPSIHKVHNLLDRIALRYTINPIEEDEVKDMVFFRLKQAGCLCPENLFSDEAIVLIYEHSQGYPRRIAMICHEALKAIVMKGLPRVSGSVVQGLIKDSVYYEKINT
jgi:general secretion pathway protein A